jgi:uncharacterized membrane protein YoaK (UPF0700 family)
MRALPVLLSVNAGYVDTAGFLALQGLFTAHVTGNFVTAGAALVLGTSGVVAKLVALPVFCIVVALARVLGESLGARHVLRLKLLLGLKLVLLFAAAGLAVRLGPFPNGDAWPALLTGMTLVSAMAIQNAVQRVHLSAWPPSTLMTGNTTQAVLDVVDLLRGTGDVVATRGRLSQMVANIAGFAIGCAAGALLFATVSMWCFAVPPLVGLAAVLLRADIPPPR